MSRLIDVDKIDWQKGVKEGNKMKLEVGSHPCASCKFGNYMNVDEKWWCGKYNKWQNECVLDCVLDKINAEMQEFRGCSGCSASCSDGIIDDIEDIINKYRKMESEE